MDRKLFPGSEWNGLIFPVRWIIGRGVVSLSGVDQALSTGKYEDFGLPVGQLEIGGQVIAEVRKVMKSGKPFLQIVRFAKEVHG